MKNNLNAAITGLINFWHSPPRLTLTGLNPKSRKAAALFNQVSASLRKIKNSPVTAVFTHLIDLAASGNPGGLTQVVLLWERLGPI